MLTPLSNLIRLRYVLLWSRARTSRGRLTLAMVGYGIVMAASLLQGIGGFRLAAFGASIDHPREVATIVLSSLSLIVAIAALGFGLGTQRAFSDQHLRRFPLTSAQRFAARFLIGILDPVWVAISAAVFGLAVGFWNAQVQQLGVALTASGLFIVVCYLIVSGVLAIVEMWIRKPRGTAFFVALGLGFGGLITLGVAVAGDRTAHPVADWLRVGALFLPGRLAAVLMTETQNPLRLQSGLALCGWAALGVILLLAAPGGETLATSRASRPVDVVYRLLARIGGGARDPLFDKALRYHLRCARLRLNALMAISLIPLMSIITAHHSGTAGGYYIGLCLLFLVGLLSTSSVTLNQFGCDGTGVRLYASLPRQPEDALRAGARASVVVGGVVALGSLAVWLGLFGPQIGARLSLAAILVATAGVPAFAGLGLWASVFAPRRSTMNGLFGSALAGPAQVIVGTLILGCFAVAFLMTESVPLQVMERFWWVTVPFAMAGCSFFWCSCRLMVRVRHLIRFRVFPLIAASSD
jgi:hypothetical protein